MLPAPGRELEREEGEAPLITDTHVKLEITVGDAQRIADALAKAFPPISLVPPGARMRRGSGRGFKPRARKA